MKVAPSKIKGKLQEFLSVRFYIEFFCNVTMVKIVCPGLSVIVFFRPFFKSHVSEISKNVENFFQGRPIDFPRPLRTLKTLF